jgi:hypothetical protein
LILWFHKIACIKENVDKFLKNKRLTSVHKHLSFKNENQWLDQINKISSNVHENEKQWLKQDNTINFKMKDELDTTVKVQYRDVIEEVKFLLSHQFFIWDLFYAFIVSSTTIMKEYTRRCISKIDNERRRRRFSKERSSFHFL